MILEEQQSLAAVRERGAHLTPARVRQAAGRRVQLELPDELPWAPLALASPYQPEVGDLVLAIGEAGSWYVIGVLEGSGTTSLAVPADLDLRAPRGRIRLMAGKGIQLKSSDVEIRADRLEVIARRVAERFVAAVRWVRKSFDLRAGRLRAQADSEYSVRAGQIVERAEGTVCIDGTRIHLG